MANILVVDDDENLCAAFRQFLSEEGHSPTIVSNAQDGIKNVEETHPDLVIMDIRMPGMDGLEGLRRIRQADPHAYVVIMTAYGTSQTSIEAIRLGAFEYLMKPLDLDNVKAVIDKALEAQALGRQALHQQLNRQEEEWTKYPLVNLIGKSPLMQAAYRMIGLLTTNDVPALLIGERGTGKQLVARTIHSNSSRKDKPFVILNCRALEPHVLDAELFGRDSGTTGSLKPIPGKIEAAHEGTLLIENFTDIPRPIQSRLYRFLIDKTAERVGGTTSFTAETRILAAINRDPAEPLQEQTFSPELYDALSVISIHLPPLRSRRTDIPDLANHFIRRSNAELHKTIRGIDDRVAQLLMDHPWSANVAEFENVIKRACILARGEVIAPDDLGDSLRKSALPGRAEAEDALQSAIGNALQQRLIDADADPHWSPFHEIVTLVEETLVREALAMTGGNQVKAAEVLGLNRATLRKKMNAGSE